MSRILYTTARHEKKMSAVARGRTFCMLAGALAVCVIAAAIFFLWRPAWQIRHVMIQGLHAVPESAIRENVARSIAGAYGWVIPRGSIIAARTGAIGDQIKKEFPAVREVAVARRFPDALDVSVTERSLWSIFCSDLKIAARSCVAIDESGYAYASSPEVTGALLLRVRSDGADVSVGSFAVEHGVVDRMRTLANGLPAAAGSAPLNFELRTELPSEIRAFMPEGYRIIFRRDDDAARSLAILKKVLDEEIGGKRKRLDYIDLRFGNKVFYKMK